MPELFPFPFLFLVILYLVKVFPPVFLSLLFRFPSIFGLHNSVFWFFRNGVPHTKKGPFISGAKKGTHLPSQGTKELQKTFRRWNFNASQLLCHNLWRAPLCVDFSTLIAISQCSCQTGKGNRCKKMGIKTKARLVDIRNRRDGYVINKGIGKENQ